MSRLRRVLSGIMSEELVGVIDDGDSEVLPVDAYFSDDAILNPYYTNDLKTNYYSSTD